MRVWGGREREREGRDESPYSAPQTCSGKAWPSHCTNAEQWQCVGRLNAYQGLVCIGQLQPAHGTVRPNGRNVALDINGSRVEHRRLLSRHGHETVLARETPRYAVPGPVLCRNTTGQRRGRLQEGLAPSRCFSMGIGFSVGVRLQSALSLLLFGGDARHYAYALKCYVYYMVYNYI